MSDQDIVVITTTLGRLQAVVPELVNSYLSPEGQAFVRDAQRAVTTAQSGAQATPLNTFETGRARPSKGLRAAARLCILRFIAGRRP